MSQKILSFQEVSYSYHNLRGETQALDRISFDVYDGEFLSIVGPSGCGKSTILSLITGILQAEEGVIQFENDTKGQIGYMLQRDQLFPWRNIWSNCILGLEIQHSATAVNKAYAEYLLKEYGLWDSRDKKPAELSGGMRQRAALIRTLVMRPGLLLLDEPFSALDFQTRMDVADDISHIIRKQGKTAVLITHDIQEAISLSDRILVLSGRPARVLRSMDIVLTKEEDTVLSARNAPEFNRYFNDIWDLLKGKEGNI